jgi:hypothetical protein
VCGSTLRILLEFLLPKDGSLVAFGAYALQFGKAVAGLPAFLQVTPEGNGSLLWDPQQDTCQQGEPKPERGGGGHCCNRLRSRAEMCTCMANYTTRSSTLNVVQSLGFSG